MRRTCLVLFTLLLITGAAWAQAPASTGEPSAEGMAAAEENQDEVTESEAPVTAPEETQATGPVPVPEPSEKAMRYYRSGMRLWIFNILWGFAVPLVILFTGFSARMRDWGKKIFSSWFLSFAAFIVIFSVVTYIIDLPLSYYQGFVRQHAYDLSNQTFAKWFGDSLKGLGVGVVITALFGWVPFMLIRKSPRRWWLYSGLLIIPFICLMLLIGPVWIAPLFNDFGPMQDKALEAEILALAERSGIEDSRVFEVDMSVDTEAVNAYVTGFMNTKRIVLWDNIIAKLDSPELLFVMAHEMGHYVLGHVIRNIFVISTLLLLGLYLVYRVSDALIDRYRDRFGFDSLGDFASLPLIMLLMSLFMFVLSPVMMTHSRHQEHEADRFGLELTQNNRDAATAFVKLQQENLGNPRPGWVYKLWRAGHPTLGDRIDFCNEYRPWETGGAIKYGHLFSNQ